MATLTRVTTAEEDAALTYATNLRNARMGTALTPRDFVMETLNGWIQLQVTEYRDNQKLSKAELYARATPADQATIDAILAKYAGE